MVKIFQLTADLFVSLFYPVLFSHNFKPLYRYRMGARGGLAPVLYLYLDRQCLQILVVSVKNCLILQILQAVKTAGAIG